MTTQKPARFLIYQMLGGYRVTGAVRAMAELGLADQLGGGAYTVDELAEATGTHAPSLARLVRALASLDLCTVDDGLVRLTPLGDSLRTDVANTTASLALLIGALYLQRAWEEMPNAVRTGQAAFPNVYGMGFWEYLSAHPQDGANFDAAMRQVGAGQAEAILAVRDLSLVDTVVDLGGGRGHLLAELLATVDGLRATLFDRPEVVPSAEEALRDARVAERCDIIGGDFFASVPADRDAYILAQILHDWPDEDALKILRTCHRAMGPGGRVWIIERLVEQHSTFDRDAQRHFNLMDLQMLVLFGAQERTGNEYRRLLEAAGFEATTVLNTHTEWSVIEGRWSAASGNDAAVRDVS